ncbi:aldehyde dehydrogenase family protein [Gordonia paraffinivorans]|uniref:aldehyde dehydrogenase family protein n=1 Tax=Gordonia paraffinivorans TaxID=175628 RepID=UPI000D6221FD|nr:aldehyde dehydrogenase family protein [Gordonia paraffinivorans]MBY4575758.1 aldehyde dehydrogenase family protein [Gordonia paraffinivorans]PWD44246.1 aldehyde dehydrogenase family protein [Gordonia paraffinivorans]
MSVTEMSTSMATTESGSALAGARAAFDSGRTRPLSWRVAQLEGLLRFIDECEPAIAAAIEADLGRDPMASFMADIAPVRHEIRHTLANLARWMKPERVRSGAAAAPGRAWIVPEPKGVALILGAWNFPILLTLHPLVSCLAAGNAAVVKPSEISAATGRFLSEQLPRYVDAEAIRIVLGGAEVSASLAGQPFDHTFFTGSTSVGRAVMAAGARNLTPVTLELGGKSPVIVAADADVDVAARRIAWAKAVNAGQTCTAPDYVLVEESVRPALVERLLAELPLRGAQDTTRIVNDRHVARLRRILSTHGGEQYGGAIDESRRSVTPALVTDPDPDSELMQEEIFGPVLPLISVPDLGSAIEFVNARPKPLALYLFTESRAVEDLVVSRTSSGSVAVNHLLYQLLVPELPFGGVGASGMGNYHGKNGFDTFSHRKAVLSKPSRPDLPMAYPPYGRAMQKVLRKLMG